MKLKLIALALPMVLSACTGANVGAGVGTGFPGIGLGAGISLPIGSSSADKDEAYVQNVIERVYGEIDEVHQYAGQLCTMRITADPDGLILSLKVLEGKEAWCGAVITAADKLRQLPKPPVSMAERLRKGLVIDFIPK
ncbi:TPA: hypothetical protein LU109_003597 [Enterobacter hormaechei subsp. xiangfangensis]|nr:hypothetical protein [Enterobacter hormaechei subsp. xiangfangensis]